MTKNKTQPEAIVDGAALLDSLDIDWFLNIDLGNLDMGSSHWCIIGQLFGSSFADGLDELADALGMYRGGDFAMDYGFDYVEDSDEYPGLDAGWTAQIRSRAAKRGLL